MIIDTYIKKYREIPVQVKASLYFFICMILQKGISIITVPIFTRLLTPVQYGKFNIFSSWMGIISVFVTLRLAYGIYGQGLVKFEKNRKEFTSAIQGLMTSLVIVSFALYFLMHKRINKLLNLNIYEMISMFVIIWATTIYEFWAGEEKVNFRYKKLVVLSLTVSILQPLCGIVAVFISKNKVNARIISIAIINFIMFAGLFFSKMKNNRIFYSKNIWIYSLKFSLPLIPHYLSQTVLNTADRIMIGKFVGDKQAGIYSLAYSLALMSTLFNGAIMETMSPWMYLKIQEKKIKDIENIAYLSLILVGIINLLLIAIAPEIIKFFAPPEYYQAVLIVPPISMSVIFLFSYDLFAKYEFYYEKTFFIMIASISGAILNIILNYIFIRKYGYLAASYTTLVCFILYALGHYLFMNRICKNNLNGIKPYNIRILLIIYSIFILMGFCLMATYVDNRIRYTFIALIIFIFILNKKRILEIAIRFKNLKKVDNI